MQNTTAETAALIRNQLAPQILEAPVEEAAGCHLDWAPRSGLGSLPSLYLLLVCSHFDGDSRGKVSKKPRGGDSPLNIILVILQTVCCLLVKPEMSNVLLLCILNTKRCSL